MESLNGNIKKRTMSNESLSKHALKIYMLNIVSKVLLKLLITLKIMITASIVSDVIVQLRLVINWFLYYFSFIIVTSILGKLMEATCQVEYIMIRVLWV